MDLSLDRNQVVAAKFDEVPSLLPNWFCLSFFLTFCRWVKRLGYFHFDINCRSRETDADADILSRYPETVSFSGVGSVATT